MSEYDLYVELVDRLVDRKMTHVSDQAWHWDNDREVRRITLLLGEDTLQKADATAEEWAMALVEGGF